MVVRWERMVAAGEGGGPQADNGPEPGGRFRARGPTLHWEDWATVLDPDAALDFPGVESRRAPAWSPRLWISSAEAEWSPVVEFVPVRTLLSHPDSMLLPLARARVLAALRAVGIAWDTLCPMPGVGPTDTPTCCRCQGPAPSWSSTPCGEELPLGALATPCHHRHCLWCPPCQTGCPCVGRDAARRATAASPPFGGGGGSRPPPGSDAQGGGRGLPPTAPSHDASEWEKARSAFSRTPPPAGYTHRPTKKNLMAFWGEALTDMPRPTDQDAAFHSWGGCRRREAADPPDPLRCGRPQ